MAFLATRKSINWRIPFDLLEKVDALRASTGQDRTSVVVAALELYLAKARVGRKKRSKP